MIYNRARRELYDNIKDAAEKIGTSEQCIISNLQDGTFLCIRKQNLERYISEGKIDIPYNEINKLLHIKNLEFR